MKTKPAKPEHRMNNKPPPHNFAGFYFGDSYPDPEWAQWMQLFTAELCAALQIPPEYLEANHNDKPRAAAIEDFDRLTAAGYKLDLITGEYFRPIPPKPAKSKTA